MTRVRRGYTDNGRTIIFRNGEQPQLARKNKQIYALWNLIKTLTPEDIQFLITKRIESLNHESNPLKIKHLKTEIRLLEDAYTIIKRKIENLKEK